MIESGRDIERLLTAILKPLGYLKKGRTWYCNAKETIAVVHLQRSQFANRYFLNIAVFIRALADLQSKYPQDLLSPKSYRCQFQVRLSNILSDRMMGDALFDLNDPRFDPRQREISITAAMRKCALPLLRKCRTLDGIRAAIREEPYLGYATYGELRRLLGQPTVPPRWPARNERSNPQ